jgi:lipopolysaccharide transport system permease protein
MGTEFTSSKFERVIRPKRGLAALNLAELWRYRELFLFLGWRDILVRYKQTYIGVAWAVVQPLLTMLIFTFVFSAVGKFPSGGVPYAVMVFAAILPWQFFSNAMSESSQSLIASEKMITKVYFPRLIIPTSAVLTGMVDFLITLVLMLGMMGWYHVAFSARMLLLPGFFLVAFIAALAVGLWLSALNVKYRDVKYVVPFIVRMGMYVAPVAFMSSKIRESFGADVHFLYCLNPLVGAIDGFRWCILGPAFEPYWPGFWASVALSLVLLVSGAFYFRSTEKSFADVI